MLESNKDDNKKLNFKFSLFKGENELSALVNKICEQNLDDKLCVVSVIGKSDLNSNSCKAELIDETLKKNVFKGCLFNDKLIDDQILNEIEGYYDIQNKVIFLHLISPMDTDQMIEVLNKLNRKLKERGFLDIWSDLNLNTIKSILLLFLISHIIVIVQPSIQIDINFLQIFRLIEKVRTRTQVSISDLLKEVTELNKNWVNSGRPCSPRVLFVFESYYLMDEQLNKHLNDNKRKYEEYLEDQLYRFLRRSRIITNLCSNALFAICNQNDFVFISTKQNSIRDTNEFFNELLHYFCDQTKDKHSIVTTNLCNELISENENQFKNNNNLISSSSSLSKSTTTTNITTSTNTSTTSIIANTNDERTFFDFLFIHIKTALTKGFDDNIGRHNQPPVFELPKLSTFSKVILTLKDFFFKQLNESRNLEFISNKLKFSLDTDNMFSEARCSKILPISISYYREKLPSNYTQEIHEQKLNQTLQFFKSQVRGLSVHKFIKLLEQDCDQFWRGGHQVCGIVSLFNNHCMNPIHRTKSNQNNLDDDDDDDDDEFNENNNLKIMEHNSNIKYISACNCGYRQCSRDDPFTIKQANNDFYYNLSMKCNCNELTSFEFPIFEGSIETARPALLNRFMHNLNLNDDYSYSDSIDGSSYEEIEEKLINDENLDLVDKLQTQLESQPLGNLSQENQNKLSFDLDFIKKETKIDNDIDLKNELKLNNLNEQDKKSIEQNTDLESTTSSTVSSFNENDLELLQKNHKKSRNKNNLIKETEFSKTEYLNGMLNNRSPKNLLPLFNSWSLVCLGSSSIYSHNLGVQNQPGFLLNCNFLLPWDVIVKIENSGDLPTRPGIKNKKVLQDGTQFTVKIFVGMEYECLKGHRFMCSKPNTVLKAQYNHIKETANQLVSSDMPLFMPCICSLNKNEEELAQLMRIHIVTPKAPVFVTLNPRIQISSPPCPIFYPMNINENKPDEMIKLTQSAYWILRLPFVYQQMINSPITKIYNPSVNCGHFLKNAIGICQYYISNNNNNFSNDPDI